MATWVILRAYKYDSNGNRIERSGEGDIVTAEYDAQDRLLRYGQTEFSYDADCNVIQKIDHDPTWCTWWPFDPRSKVTNYSYDAFGNLVSVELPDHTKIGYILDGQFRRIGKTVNGKLVRGWVYQSQTQIAAELDGAGNIVKQFIYGEKANIPDFMIMGTETYQIVSDQVGTPRLVINASSGVVKQVLNFDEFGVPQGEDGEDGEELLPFGFAGGLWDRATDLVHFGARDYNPETGRWVSKDPLLFGGGDTDLYGYVLNDPVDFTDPEGLSGPLSPNIIVPEPVCIGERCPPPPSPPIPNNVPVRCTGNICAPIIPPNFGPAPLPKVPTRTTGTRGQNDSAPSCM